MDIAYSFWDVTQIKFPSDEFVVSPVFYHASTYGYSVRIHSDLDLSLLIRVNFFRKFFDPGMEIIVTSDSLIYKRDIITSEKEHDDRIGSLVKAGIIPSDNSKHLDEARLALSAAIDSIHNHHDDASQDFMNLMKNDFLYKLSVGDSLYMNGHSTPLLSKKYECTRNNRKLYLVSTMIEAHDSMRAGEDLYRILDENATRSTVVDDNKAIEKEYKDGMTMFM